jgi:drug/metabolite transporter (DMT)-like permease
MIEAVPPVPDGVPNRCSSFCETRFGLRPARPDGPIPENPALTERPARIAATPGGTSLLGVLCVMGSAVAFSTNDMAIKWLSGDYPLHQITFIRSILALILTVFVLVPMEGSLANLRTRRLPLHLIRGLTIVSANMCYFTGLATLSLGEATAIYFMAPLFITAFSVILLGETVGWRRWLAVLAGFAGVMLVMRPGGSAFQYASLLALSAACLYALAQIMARVLGRGEKASVMAFYIQLVFLMVSSASGLAFGDGRFSGSGNDNLEFLFRPWIWPETGDLLIMFAIGILATAGTYLVSQGYRLVQAGLAAPFEYVAMPLGVFWSIVLWSQWPDLFSWLGIVLIAGAGIFVFIREAMQGRSIAWKLPGRRER